VTAVGYALAGGLELTVGLAWYWITRASTEGMRWLLDSPDAGLT
jgi:hypothetical protein